MSAKILKLKYIHFYSHADKTHTHKIVFALTLVLKERVFVSRKWPIIYSVIVLVVIFKSSGDKICGVGERVVAGRIDN